MYFYKISTEINRHGCFMSIIDKKRTKALSSVNLLHYTNEAKEKVKL